MHKVRITGWRYGLNKVGMTKTIRAHLGLDLADAKHCTDRVVEGVEVTLEAPNAGIARTLVRELDELGATVALEPDPHP